MNRFLKFTNLLVFVALIFNACQENEQNASPQKTLDKTRIEVLAKRSYQENGSSDRDDNTIAFNALTAEELDYFNESRKSLDKAMLETVYTNGISESKFKSVEAEIDAIYEMRKEINRLSLEVYGKSYNQLNGEQLDNVISKSNNALFIPQSSANTSAKVSDCIGGLFSGRAYTGAPSIGVAYIKYYLIKPNGQGECDYVFRYPGNFTRVFATTSLDKQLLALHQNKLLKRNLVGSGVSTEIVFDYNKVILTHGSPSLIRIKMF